ncbi:hypothetical protein DL98DRAFT_7965 [Cadophora sp. DSE1049]|nr:hypothetical protein DL98DRAFT_7965 [Cadophora sp. DSE1049]
MIQSRVDCESGLPLSIPTLFVSPKSDGENRNPTCTHLRPWNRRRHRQPTTRTSSSRAVASLVILPVCSWSKNEVHVQIHALGRGCTSLDKHDANQRILTYCSHARLSLHLHLQPTLSWQSRGFDLCDMLADCRLPCNLI